MVSEMAALQAKSATRVYARAAVIEKNRTDALIARFVFIQEARGGKRPLLERHGHDL
jgi:hypothetical protein